MIFYLRKIEGAEVLLAYETNLFRQEIHKWQPVAPEPPPILEQSLSTRKPRPTKQQKIMARMGIERPEDLPVHLRPKQPNPAKRKSIDSQHARPPSLQPSQPPGDNSNADSSRMGPTLTPGDTQNPPYPFSASYSLPASDSTSAFAPESSAFLPHVAADSTPFPARSPSPAPHHGLSSALFSPPRYSRTAPSGPPGPEVDHSNPFGSSPRNLDDVFADLTNQDADPEADQEPDELMENTHANEALELLDVGNDRESSAPAPDGEVEEKPQEINGHPEPEAEAAAAA